MDLTEFLLIFVLHLNWKFSEWFPSIFRPLNFNESSLKSIVGSNQFVIGLSNQGICAFWFGLMVTDVGLELCKSFSCMVQWSGYTRSQKSHGSLSLLWETGNDRIEEVATSRGKNWQTFHWAKWRWVKAIEMTQCLWRFITFNWWYVNYAIWFLSYREFFYF